MQFAKDPNVLTVIPVGEGRPVWLAHPVDDDDARTLQPTSAKLGGIGVLKQAEQAELLAARAGETDLVVAPHRPVHGLPLATTAELWWRSGGDRVEHGVELGVDLGGASIEEVRGRNAAVVVS